MKYAPAALIWAAFVGACLFMARSPAALLQPRWDAEQYVSIADRGYELHDCSPFQVSYGYTICGNIWYPGWPIWNRLSRRIAPSWFPIHAWCSLNAMLAFLLVLELMSLKGPELLRGPGRKHLGLWGCAALVCQPASFYYLTQFPYSFVLAGGFLFLLFYRRRSPFGLAGAAAAGFWCGFAYTSSFLFGVFPFFDFVREPRGWRRLIGWGAVLLSGTAVFCLILKHQFGDFFLYYKFAAQWQRGWVDPLTVILDLVRSGNAPERLAFLWYAVGFFVVALRLKSAKTEPAFYYFAAVLVLTPITGTWMRTYRHYLLALPLGLLIGGADLPDLWKLAYFASGLYLQFADFFPSYLADRLV